MEAKDDFLKQLEPILLQLNLQNLSKANSAQNAGSNTGGSIASASNDPIGNLIQESEDRAKLDELMAQASQSSIANPVAGITNTVPAPKTNDGPLVGPAVEAPVGAKTTVTKPSPYAAAAKYSPLINAVAPEQVTAFTKKYAVPNDKVTAAILAASKETGVDADTLFRFARAESKFYPTNKAKTSSATGLFQFLDSTWNYVMHSLGGKENFDLTGNRKDPYENAVAGAIYLNEIKQNMARARKSGQFSIGELYMGHFAGPGTAAKAIQLIDAGKGSAPATSVFGKDQIAKNKPIFYDDKGKLRSVSQVLQTLSGRVS